MKERNTERLIACVMENMADEAIRILRSGFFNKKVLEDVGGCRRMCNKIASIDDYTMPLYSSR